MCRHAKRADGAPVSITECRQAHVRRTVRHPHPPTEMLLPFVSLALRHPIPPTPRCTACCLIWAKAQEPRARTALGVLSPKCFPSRALPAPHSRDDNYLVGEWVSNKTSFGSTSFLPLASPRIIFLQQRARVLFGNRLPASARNG
jgi:hypothetical protein